MSITQEIMQINTLKQNNNLLSRSINLYLLTQYFESKFGIYRMHIQEHSSPLITWLLFSWYKFCILAFGIHFSGLYKVFIIEIWSPFFFSLLGLQHTTPMKARHPISIFLIHLAHIFLLRFFFDSPATREHEWYEPEAAAAMSDSHLLHLKK